MNTNKIEDIRKVKKITIDEVCKKVGITKNTYINLRRSGDFRVSHLESIAELFKIDICIFFKESHNYIDQINEKPPVYENHNSEYEKEISYLKQLLKEKDKVIELLKKTK
ncbi:MAG: helix-turn-helix domain-containing protein [Bacteroidales bacterium]|nr:helix-turn-helix domain-containing protein [Bacteroidales bacterium]